MQYYVKLTIGIDPASLAPAVTNTVVMFTPFGYSRMTVVHVHPMAYDAGCGWFMTLGCYPARGALVERIT